MPIVDNIAMRLELWFANALGIELPDKPPESVEGELFTGDVLGIETPDKLPESGEG